MFKDYQDQCLRRSACIVPILNPDDDFLVFVRSLRNHFGPDFKIMIVNDGSDFIYQPIFEIARKDLGCIVLEHPGNYGKGKALKTAFAEILENYPEIKRAVTVDGDGQHALEDIEKLLKLACDHEHALILGVRDFTQTQVPTKSRLGNQITRKMMGLFFGMKLKDTQTGLRVIPREFLDQLIKLEGDRYEYETRMLVEAKLQHWEIVEETIHTIYLNGNQHSHFRAVKDSFLVYKIFIRYLVSAVSSFMLDILLFKTVLTLAGSLGQELAIIVASIVSRISSSFFNYNLNKRWVFKADEKTNSFMRYASLVVIQLSCSTLLVLIGTKLYPNQSETLIKVIVDTVLFVLSFIIQRLWVFRSKQKAE